MKYKCCAQEINTAGDLRAHSAHKAEQACAAETQGMLVFLEDFKLPTCFSEYNKRT